MKKSVILVSALLAASFLLSSCSPIQFGSVQPPTDIQNGTADETDEKDSVNAIVSESDTSEPNRSEADNEKSDSESNKTPSGKISVKETVLADEADIKITAKELGKGYLGPELKLLIENNTDKNLTFQCRSASVNGYMVDTILSCDVAAGKKANDALTFMKSSLEAAGITDIADMEFILYSFDDNWEDYHTTERLTLKTSIADTYSYVFDDSGEVAYDRDGIKIVIKGLAEERSVLGQEILLYIENATDRSVTVQQRNLSVNGYMVSASLSCDILPGKHAVDRIVLFNSDLENNDIDTVENMGLSFHIFDTDTWEDIVETDAVTVTF